MDFSDKNILLFNENCLNKLKELKNDSIDCIITDPPYFIDGFDNKWDASKIKDSKPNSHIKHLPKGMKFDKKQVKQLYDFYLEFSKIVFDKIKPGGYFLSFSSPRLYHALAMAVDIAGFEIRDSINWVYTQSMPKGMKVNHIIDKLNKDEKVKEDLKKEYENFKTPQIKSCHEPICVAMKPIKTTFLINELNFKTGLINFSTKVGSNYDKVISNVITTEEIDIIYDNNFLISKVSKKEKGNIDHPTMKPVELLEHLIKIFSKKNSIVCDPFMGSGSTGLACKNLNRRFIGIEIDQIYYNLCYKRLI